MSSFVLKIIACITMFFDHLSYAIYGKTSFLNYIGRISFPIFAFQIAQGYTHTKNLNKYIIRLFVFAIISQIPFYLFCSTFTTPSLNIFFTLLLGLFAIISYDKLKNKFLSLFLIFGLAMLAELIKTDYGAFGVLLILTFFVFKNSKINTLLSFFTILVINYGKRIIDVYLECGYQPKYSFTQISFAVCTFLAIIPILLYDNKQGPKMKYFLYLFYPIHLFVLYFSIVF